VSAAYELEYGIDTLEIHEDAVGPGDRVLLVDDVLATGGTAAATASLIEGAGATLSWGAVVPHRTRRPRGPITAGRALGPRTCHHY
jgi:adenine phosphoribosyltransferase